jgi:hypothetical protein
MYIHGNQKLIRHWAGGGGERGGLTVFSAILVLILMTLMIVYAVRVGLFETRMSANDVRQKAAFHVAEAAVDQGLMYLAANANVLLSQRVDAFPDGTLNGMTKDGWLVAGSENWKPCPATPAATHPCGGDPVATQGSYFWDTDGNAATFEAMPLDETGFPAGVTARLTASLCIINPGSVTCDAPAPITGIEESSSTFVITLLAYGYSDCTNTADISSCTGEATIALPVSNTKKLAGTPGVPLTSKSTFPANGTAEVVANPNASGVGVPISAWLNDNPACSSGIPAVSSGTWQTCELEEWYGVGERPAGVACSTNQCGCGTDFMSYRDAGVTHLGIDIVSDPLFPCELFDLYFGKTPALVKGSATVLPNCLTLGPGSSGLYWISGSTCTLKANTQYGSPSEPLILISAAFLTTISGGAEFFGLLYIWDGEDATAEIRTMGDAAIYGAAVIDASIDKFTGTFQVVYSDIVLGKLQGTAGLGAVNGGWRDFGLPEIGW